MGCNGEVAHTLPCGSAIWLSYVPGDTITAGVVVRRYVKRVKLLRFTVI